MAVYYNENDPYAAEWLRNLIAAGLLPDGYVDERSIVDVRPEDLWGFTQCHLFAGIGVWSHAARLAGWPDDRPLWTGSCPCQPFSFAGQRQGTNDPRHLWPHFFRLIRANRPPVIMGEQVAGKDGYGWFDGVRSDLERETYAARAIDVPACAVDAPHLRQRLYWVADTDLTGLQGRERIGTARAQEQSIGHIAQRGGGGVADSGQVRRDGWPASDQFKTRHGGGFEDGGQPNGTDDSGMADHDENGWELFAPSRLHGEGSFGNNPDGCSRSFWADHIWLTDKHGKTRRAKPGLPLLAHGVTSRVGKLRAFGNAIVAPLAAEVIKAYMDVTQ